MKESEILPTKYADMPDQIVAGEGLWKGRLLKFDRLKSTNEWAMEHLDFCRNGDVVWAVRQTTGRGRLSRSWLAPDDRGLTLSVVMTGLKQDETVPVLGQIAALAVRDTLEEYSIYGRLKWPNDVLVNGRKIAGILAEVDFDRNSVVLGIGVNVNMSEDDMESARLARSATSMLIEGGRAFDIDSVRECFISELERAVEYVVLDGTSHVADVWARYDWLAGCMVEIRGTMGTARGKYAGLDGRGRLRVIDGQGRERVFWAGDVEKIVLGR